MNKNKLKTDVLPEFNCSNCEYFVCEKNVVAGNSIMDFYAIECKNLVHPIEDCILRGFKGHSLQPSFSQTLNKKI